MDVADDQMMDDLVARDCCMFRCPKWYSTVRGPAHDNRESTVQLRMFRRVRTVVTNSIQAQARAHSQ
jgi:hypothetical protein